MSTKNIFETNENDESLKSKVSGVFGLNTGTLTKLEFNDKAGRDKTDGNAIDMEVTIEGRQYFNRFFLSESVYGKNNNLLNPGDEGYEDAYYDNYAQVVAVIRHALTAVGVSDKDKNKALAGIDNSNLIEGMQKLVALLPANHADVSIDIFLEYQWNIPEGKDKTYLILPRNMKGGAFLCPAVTPVGKWTIVRTEESIHYIDDSGNKHPLVKDKSFVDSPRSKQQGVDDAGTTGNTPSGIQSATKSSW